MKPPLFWLRRGGISLILRPFSWMYRAVGFFRYFLKRPYKVSKPVLCVGNVVMGGAGKTPVVLALIEFLKEEGHAPHVLSRGYGGKLSGRGPVLVNPFLHTAADVGDEPLLLAEKAPTWVGKNRILSAKAAIQSGATLLIMDDGFQNPSLYKDISLLVLNTTQGHGNGLVFPAGPLREPLKNALKRAHAVICIEAPAPSWWLNGINDLPPFFQGTLVSVGSHSTEKCTDKYVAFAGIGYPEKFHRTLQKSGVTVVDFYPYADHHPYTEEDLNFLAKTADELQASLITTTKDYVRLPPHWQSRVRSWKINLCLSDNLKKWMTSRLQKC